MDIESIAMAQPRAQDLSGMFTGMFTSMPTSSPSGQAASSLSRASPGRTAYIGAWASAIRNFSMSPASFIRIASSMRTASSRMTGFVGSEALPILVEDAREDTRVQSTDDPVPEQIIGQFTITGKFICLSSQCSAISFGRQADFRRHYERTHNADKFEYYCPLDGCQRSMQPSGRRKSLSFGIREDKMREHVRIVHEIGRRSGCEDTDVGDEAVYGVEGTPGFSDLSQPEVQPATTASSMSRAPSMYSVPIVSQASPIHIDPTTTGSDLSEALPAPVKAVTEVLGDQSSNALQSHNAFPVPYQIEDENFNAFNLRDEQLYLHLSDSDSSSSIQHVRTGSGDMSTTCVISKTPYVRPPHPKILCQFCNERPEGFRGTHELDGHIAQAHSSLRKRYVCIDRSPDKKFLAGCKHCRTQKVYGAYYNAAAHLRIHHFDPRKPGRKDKIDKIRGGTGGGNHSAMDFPVAQWIKEVDVNNKVIQSISPSNSNPEESDNNEVAGPQESIIQHLGNQGFKVPHGNDSVPFEQGLDLLAPERVQLEGLHIGNTDNGAYQSADISGGKEQKRTRDEADEGNEGASGVKLCVGHLRTPMICCELNHNRRWTGYMRTPSFFHNRFDRTSVILFNSNQHSLLGSVPQAAVHAIQRVAIRLARVSEP